MAIGERNEKGGAGKVGVEGLKLSPSGGCIRAEVVLGVLWPEMESEIPSKPGGWG